MSKEKLMKKIKSGLIKSGFPLEMKISNILSANNWNYGMNDLFYDFETDKYRESDIHATKTIKGTAVHLFIECKKSDKKQMLLYCPKKKNINALEFLFSSWVKKFPSVDPFKKDDINAFLKIDLFNPSISWAKNIIFSKGDKIEQDNISFFSSLNGLLKTSIKNSLDGYLKTGYRSIYFYIVIWDGLMFEIKNSKEQDFILNEINYGQYAFEYNFKLSKGVSNGPYKYKEYKEIISTLGNKYLIEVFKPQELEKKLIGIEEFLKRHDEELQNWGEKWPN